MKKIGLLKAIRLTYKADRMTDKERYLLQQKRLKELISYAKSNSPQQVALALSYTMIHNRNLRMQSRR